LIQTILNKKNFKSNRIKVNQQENKKLEKYREMNKGEYNRMK